MPRRRWTDWAACVARTAIATGYMFEMHMARRMTAALVSNEHPENEVQSAFDASDRLFAWDDRLERVAADVGPTMTRLAAVGSQCLSLLADHVDAGNGGQRIPAFSEYDDDPDGLCNWLVKARKVVTSDIRERISLL